MSTGAFVLVAALVVAAQIVFAFAYGNGAEMAHSSERIELEFERELHALIVDAIAIDAEDRTAPRLEN